MVDVVNERGVLDTVRDTTVNDTDLCQYDIVAVHGWGSGTDSSWSFDGDGSTWLKDLLPSSIGGARIMTFSYKLHSKRGITALDVRDQAMSLLEQLREKDPYEPRRNLIFVGHDLGGVIAKQAIVAAIQAEKYSSIAARTTLMIFFGTPHRASDLNGWEKIVGALMFSNQDACLGRLSDVIRTSAKALREASSDFSVLRGVYNTLNIVQDTDDILVISEASATLGTKEEQVIKLKKPHAKLGHLSRADSEDPEIPISLDGGRKAWTRICEMITHSSGHPDAYVTCLRTLFKFWDSTNTALDPYLRALDRLQGHTRFRNWLQSSSGFTAVHGTATSDLPLLHIPSSEESEMKEEQVIGFVFDLADATQISEISMLASMAIQLLCGMPVLFDHVSHIFSYMAEKPDWRVDTMWALFRTLASCPNHSRVICMIKADEHHMLPGKSALNRFLHWTTQEASMLRVILLTSTSVLDPCPSLAISLDDEQLPKQTRDVDLAAKEAMSDFLYANPAFECVSGELEQTIQKMVQTARGLSAGKQVGLVSKSVFSLMKRMPSWSTKSSLKAKIDALPSTLPDLYIAGINEIPLPQQAFAWKILSWMAWSRRPLKLAELRLAVVLEPDMASISEIQDELSQDLAAEIQVTLGGLVCIEDSGTARFLHSTIKDFVLASHPDLAQPQWCRLLWRDGDAGIARICLNYLRLLRDERLLTAQPLNDLASYANQYWPEHYQRSKAEKTDLTPFFSNVELMSSWASSYQDNQHSGARAPQSDLLAIAAEAGCSDLVKHLLKDPSRNFNIRAALEAAISRGDQELVRLLHDFNATTPLASCIAAARGHKPLLGSDHEIAHNRMEGFLPIHLACESGHLEMVQELHRTSADVSVLTDEGKGMTPLHVACQSGHSEIISTLLCHSADISATDASGQTPLHVACLWQQPQAVRLLVGTGKADICAVDNHKQTPVHLAAKAGRSDIMDILLPRDSQATRPGSMNIPNLLLMQDNTGATPLHLAAGTRSAKDVAERLLELVDSSSAVQDNDGNTPLHIAAKNGSADMVELLCRANSRIINDVNHAEETPFHLAVGGGHVESVDLFLNFRNVEGKLDLDARNTSCSAPLHLATRKRSKGIVKLLLMHDAWVDITDRHYKTPLVIASEKGFYEIVELLLEFGADVEMRNNEGRTALSVASISGHLQVVEILLNHGADPNDQDIRGGTPLFLASRYQNIDVVKLLVKKGAGLEIADKQGWRALHAACKSAEILRILLKDAKADVAAQTRLGLTVLHISTLQGYSSSVKTLLELDADPLSLDNDGETPFHHAVKVDENVGRMMLEKVMDRLTPLLTSMNDDSVGLANPLLDDSQFTIRQKADIFYSAIQVALRQRDQTLTKLLLEKVDTAVLSKMVPRLLECIVEFDNIFVAGPFVAHFDDKLDFNNFLDEHGWTLKELVDAFRLAERREHGDQPSVKHLLPSQWSETDKHRLIEVVDDDRKIIRYASTTYSGAASIGANHPMPASQAFYCEVTILNQGIKGIISIGVCHKGGSLRALPGWRGSSWGYHGDDGGMYHDDGNSAKFHNEGFGTGQVIGCLVFPGKGVVRFTRDGIPLDNEFKDVYGRLFPVVGLETLEAEVMVNFGPDNFKYQFRGPTLGLGEDKGPSS